MLSVIAPFIANHGGWVAAEVGRQPWIVYNLLRTEDALSAAVQAEQILISIIMFAVIYILLFIVWITILDRKIKAGPDDEYSELEDAPARKSWIDTAALLAAPSGTSITDSTGESKKSGGE